MAPTAVAERADTRQANPLVTLRHELEQRASEFRMALPAHISPEKFQRTILTAVQSTPVLLQADRRSFIRACMKAAQDGLLPDGREAALVEFKTRQKGPDGQFRDVRLIQYMPMAFGLRKKILQSGEVRDIFAAVVYRQEIEAGLFIYEEGTERMLRHKPLLDPGFDPTDDDIAVAYSIATLGDGSKVFEVMRRSDINKIRQMSQTGALGKTRRDGTPIPPKGPWVDWFSEMAKKSVMRRHSKMLPMSGDIIDVEAMDEAAAARSTSGVLGAVDEAPAALSAPRRDDLLASSAAFDDIDHDAETGEVIEGTAEQADPPADAKAKAKLAQKPREKRQEAAAADNPAAEGKPDEERGEARTATESDEARATRLIAEAQAKEMPIDLGQWERERQAECDALPEDLQFKVDEAIAAHRRKLEGGRK